MNLEAILEQTSHARPGYALVAFKEAALPIFLLTARVLTVEKKPLSPIEEACLRAMDAGLDSPEDISEFLGLSRAVLTGTFAALNSRECISYTRAVGTAVAKVILTDKGKLALIEAKTVVPQERLVKLAYDPYLKRVAFISTNSLFKPRDVRDAGWLEIPLAGAKRPEVEDISIQELDRVIQRLRARDEETSELLSLRRIERREMHFLPCLLIFYKSLQGKDIQVAFYQDEGFSLDHENAFRNLGGPELVGSKNVMLPAELPDVGKIFGAVDMQAEFRELESTTQFKAVEKHASPPENRINAAVPRPLQRAMTQRLVRCHEHPGLLTKALTTSTRRLLIISPWITDQVVNLPFYRSLETLLRNGVEVHIGYGLEENATGRGEKKPKQKSSPATVALRELEKIQHRFSNFSFQFIGNTHRKHLVCDDKFAVVSSFNWLSFRGDPKRKARDELGFLVTEPDDVERLFKDGISLLKQGYDHPASVEHRS